MVKKKAAVSPPRLISYAKDRVKWSSVPLSEVVAHGLVLTASAYDVDVRYYRYLVEQGKYPTVPLSELTDAYVCSRFRRIWVAKSDLPIYQPSAAANMNPRPDGFLSRNTKTNIDALRVRKGQVLLTCSGTIGNVSYVSDTLDAKIFSHDLMRLNFAHSCNAGYVYTYLKSAVGTKLLTASSYGAVITHIEPEHLVSVPIPNPPDTEKQHIHELITASYRLRDEANALIDKATAMLLKELNLPPDIDSFYPPTDSVKCFSVKLAELQGRFDVSYHLPIVKKIKNHLAQYAAEVTNVGDKRVSRDVILPGRFKRMYVDEGRGRVFIGGKQIGELDPSNKKYLSASYHEQRIYRELELHENMTLITCSGTVGRVNLVPRHWENWAASQHIIRVVPANDDLAGYLYIFLASPYALPLIMRNVYGAVIDEIDAKQVGAIPIPLLENQARQTQINTLALTANAKRYEAYRLEQEAIRYVNEEIISV
ncbi:MAG: restriction endonuclease subunit S [Selenomonadaceae bacterium]|nr:restriction endonuclease subunit S [Selenomonadaceae bacterium]